MSIKYSKIIKNYHFSDTSKHIFFRTQQRASLDLKLYTGNNTLVLLVRLPTYEKKNTLVIIKLLVIIILFVRS